METSLMVYDYPEPEEIKERPVDITVTVSYTISFDAPDSWNNDDIREYVEYNLNDLPLCDEKIEYIEIN